MHVPNQNGGQCRCACISLHLNHRMPLDSLPIDPLQPVLSTMTSDEILKIVGGRDTLRFSGTQEILHDRIRVVTEGNLDGTFETVEIPVVGWDIIRTKIRIRAVVEDLHALW